MTTIEEAKKLAERIVSAKKLLAEFNRAQAQISARFNAAALGSFPDPLSENNTLIHKFMRQHGIHFDDRTHYNHVAIFVNVRQCEQTFNEDK